MRNIVLLILVGGCAPHLTSPGGAEDPSDGWTWTAPENEWVSNAPSGELDGEGFSNGEVVRDFLLLDQNGDEVAMWQFYGQLIALDISTMWCAPCRQLALEAEETSAEYAEHGFVYLTILTQNEGGQSPTQEDLGLWASEFGLSSPVIADPDASWSAEAVGTNALYPQLLVIGRDMRVAQSVEPTTDSNLRAALDANL